MVVSLGYLVARFSVIVPGACFAFCSIRSRRVPCQEWTRDGYIGSGTTGIPRCEELWDCGIVVRSRSIIGNLGAALQTIVGGNITLLTNLCEKTRADAFELLLQHAAEHGANAVIAMRYDATEVMQGVTEVLAYGTAVQVERIS